MSKVISACAFSILFGALFGFSAQANELDKETPISTEQAELSKNLPRTVIVRTKVGTNQAEVLQSKNLLSVNGATKKSIAKAKFIKLGKNGQPIAKELDQDSSTSSWYFWCNPYGGSYYPNYYYYGYTYNYQLTYSYYYGGYNYAYYGWPYYRW